MTDGIKKLAFGIDNGHATAWGARAILRGGFVDIVPDRQQMRGTKAEKARLVYAFKTGAMDAAKAAGAALAQDAPDAVLFEDNILCIVGAARGGYLYLGAWLKSDPEELQRLLLRYGRDAAESMWEQCNDEARDALTWQADESELPTQADVDWVTERLPEEPDADDVAEFGRCYWNRIAELAAARGAADSTVRVRRFLDIYTTDFVTACNSLVAHVREPEAYRAWSHLAQDHLLIFGHSYYVSDFVRGLLAERPATPPKVVDGLISLLVCAFEGGSNYWATGGKLTLAGIQLRDVETGEIYTADYAQIWAAFDTLDRAPWSLDRWMREIQEEIAVPGTGGATTGDNWLQLVMFGEVQFG